MTMFSNIERLRVFSALAGYVLEPYINSDFTAAMYTRTLINNRESRRRHRCTKFVCSGPTERVAPSEKAEVALPNWTPVDSWL